MLTSLQKIGLCGEKWVAGQIEQHGFRCRLLPDFMHAGADIVVEERLLVEVKYAQPTTRRVVHKSGSVCFYDRWQWHVASVDGMNATCLFLVAQDRTAHCYPFIMPTWMMGDRSHFQLTSHPTKYTGLIADFMNNWDVLKYMLRRGWKKGEPGPWGEINHDG